MKALKKKGIIGEKTVFSWNKVKKILPHQHKPRPFLRICGVFGAHFFLGVGEGSDEIKNSHTSQQNTRIGMLLF
jgi:hypothetical protein